jgi:hypothetical protein
MQSFIADPARNEISVALDQQSRALKEKMVAAHETQKNVLQGFSLDSERFRLAPAYDFTALPNDGRLHYEAMPWGMTGKRWLELTTAALNELGIATTR